MIFLLLVVIALLSVIAVHYLVGFYSKQGFLDEPNERSMHTVKTPTGAGIVITTFVSLAALYFSIAFQSILAVSIFVIIAGLGCIGWVDDKVDLRARVKLAVSFVLALVLCVGVGVVDQFYIDSELSLKLPYALAMLITVLGFLWLTNLYNFMDGMDGLAALQAIIAASGFSIIFLQSSSEVSVLLSVCCGVLIAATIGFIVWNWHPAKIFMGDVGSLAIGGFFSILIVCAMRYFQMSLVSAILMVGVFVFDATYTLCARIYRRENLAQAHKTHLYQRLATAGISHDKIVSAYGCFMALLAALSIALHLKLISLLVAGVFLLMSVVLSLRYIVKIEQSKNKKRV